MTIRRMSSRRTHVAVRLASLLLLLVTGLALSPTAIAGSDDFEFGKKLADKGRATGDATWFEYARRVYDSMIADKSRSKTDHDLARYGIADLARDRALAAASRNDVPYAIVRTAFNDAVSGIEQFVRNNPKHPEVSQAKMSVGTVRLAFVQWARDLLGDAETLAERNASDHEVQADAREMVEAALRYFDELRTGWEDTSLKEEELVQRQLANYNWVVCKYYAALVFPPCSDEARAALASAGDALEDFIGYFDGMLVAIYAQDFYGLTFWELARCAAAEDEQSALYRSAVDWFETCIETEWEDGDTLRIIARGYYHIGQCCHEAGRVGGENFLKKGAGFLSKMQTKVPTVASTDDGIKALIEWAKIEARLDNTDKAIEILSEAGQKAEESGRPWLAKRVNDWIGKILKGGSSTSGAVTASPDVLKRVADNQFTSKNWLGAIGAYQKVIQSCSDSLDDLETYEIPAWERIAQCYHELGDLLSAALATEPIHAAWLDGRIPRKKDDPNDANLVRMGNIRKRAEKAMNDLADQTQSPVYIRRFKAMRDTFMADYPLHPQGELGEIRKANDHYDEAGDQRRKKDSAWKQTLAKAIEAYEGVAKDTKSQAQHYALVKLIRCENMREDWRAMVKRADAAFAYWASPECVALVKQHETVASRVKQAKGLATYWKAVALLELKGYDQVIDMLKDFSVEHEVGNPVIEEDALGMLVLAYVAKGDIDTADTHLRRLLRQYPTYFRLPKITFELADYYNAKYSEIETLYIAALVKKYGPPEDRPEGLVLRLRTAEKEENFIAERLIDLNGDRNKAQRLIDMWEEAVAKAKAENKSVEDFFKGAEESDVDEARAMIAGDPERWPDGPDKYTNGLDKTIEENNARLKEAKARREKLEGELIDVNKELEGYKQGMYPPLVKAANYYYDWMVVAEENGEKISDKNLEIFGYRFYYATVLDPADPDNWIKAMEIYERHTKLSGVSDDSRSDVAAKLGRIYSHLSDISQDEAEKKKYVLQAVDLLQAAVAKLPENNALIVGLLTGEFVVLPYRSPLDDLQYRIPIRLVTDVADFRAAVKQLGSDAAPLPKSASDRRQKGFDDAVREFQNDVVKMTDKELVRTVKGFATAGFDTNFFSEHGNTNKDFMLSLARVYAQSGRPEDARKALSLCQTLLNSRALGLDDGSEEYWDAQVIKFGAFNKAAEVGLAGANTKAEAKEMLELAARSLKALYSQDPSLGKNVREETAQQLRDVLSEMNLLRQRAGMSMLKLNLRAKDMVSDSGNATDDDKDK